MITHKWPMSGKSGKCERHGCVAHRHHSKHGKFSFTQGPDGEASTSPGPCTGKAPEKKAEPVDDGRHRWGSVDEQGVRWCLRDGCNASFRRGKAALAYQQHNRIGWGKLPGHCKGER